VPDLQAVHDRLRAMLEPYRERLAVTSDGPAGMVLELPGYEGQPWGYAAATRLGKRYVSFYLLAIYGDPKIMDGMSPALRRRMQGKSCFNFTTIDEVLFAELAALTEKSIALQPAVVEAMRAARPRR
jgi:hypothetical protein